MCAKNVKGTCVRFSTFPGLFAIVSQVQLSMCMHAVCIARATKKCWLLEDSLCIFAT